MSGHPVVIVTSVDNRGACWWCRVCEEVGGDTATNEQAQADAERHQRESAED